MPLHHHGDPQWYQTFQKPTKLLAADLVTLKQLQDVGYSTQAVAADGDRFFLYYICKGDETMLSISTRKTTISGIFELWVNGELDTAGLDDYAAVAANVHRYIALTKLPHPGFNVLELRVNGKNGASGGFGVGVYMGALA